MLCARQPAPSSSHGARSFGLWGLAALVVLIAAAVVVLILVDSSGNTPVVGNHENNTPPKSTGAPVAIEEATDYDPEGDGHEEPGTVEFAVDGNPTGTSWTTACEASQGGGGNGCVTPEN